MHTLLVNPNSKDITILRKTSLHFPRILLSCCVLLLNPSSEKEIVLGIFLGNHAE